ncbi:hypothetical protein ACFL0F_02235 [Patescibacteria group bacterium]
MKNFLKSISSFLIAFAILLGILFLPDNSYETLHNTLNFFSKSDNTTISFIYYMFQKAAIGTVILGVTVLLSVATHRVYKNQK